MEGLWAMKVSSEDANGYAGAGVLYADGAGAWGGSDSHAWSGVVEEKDGGVRGSFNVTRYNTSAPAMHPDLENPNFFVVAFSGGAHPEKFWARAEVLGQPEIKWSIELRRVA